MKTTNIYLAVLTTLFTTFTFAGTIEREDQNLETEVTTNVTGDLKKPIVSVEEEIKVMDSIAIYDLENQEVMESTILENERIIESEEIITWNFDKTIEETIREDNQIIESNIVNETFPLDFELINSYDNAHKNADFKNTAFDKNNLKS